MKIVTAKPKTVGDQRYNRLRKILRKAMNKTKQQTWSDDLKIAKTANWQWDALDKIFKKLGGYP